MNGSDRSSAKTSPMRFIKFVCHFLAVARGNKHLGVTTWSDFGEWRDKCGSLGAVT